MADAEVKERIPDPVRTDTAALDADALLEGLNPEQRRAVTHGDGPMLIVAGAGTGKTTVIARRVAWLIATGKARPEEILALTFTDKAANEMVERIDRLLPMGYVDLWVSTFHSFCQRLLESHGMDIGLPGEFRLLSGTDAYLLVRRELDRFDLDYYRPLGNPTKFIQAMLRHFSRAKDEAVLPEDYLAYVRSLALDKDASGSGDADDATRLTELANAYHAYQRLLLEKGCLDLGDLQLYAIELLRKRPAILRRYRAQFKYVVVDEFQDTNWAQYELVKMLAGGGGNITVVGDDDQSIYKFRGASISNILQFKNDFPSSVETVLTRNYRSRQNILDLAYGFIQKNNPNRLEARLSTPDGGGITKRLIAEREGQGTVAHLHYATAEDEVAGVAAMIERIKAEDRDASWSDFCILVRSNASADPFSAELQRRGIPFQFLALRGLYAKPVILDCLAYFRLLDDYHESPALYRVLSSPPYAVAGKDLVALAHEAHKKTESLYETTRRHAALPGLAPETRAVLDRLHGDIERHTQLARSKAVSEVLVKFMYESGYMGLLTKERDGAARESIGYLKQFLDRIRRYESMHDDPSLRHFMEEYDMERESGDSGGLAFDVESGPDMVRIMTVHAAKGLEFPFVFVANMVDKRFPTVGRGGDIELPDALTKEIVPEGDIHLEEERRLFYVAVTRAKDGLFLTSAEDYGGKTKKRLSRFLGEVGFEKPAQAPTVDVLEVPPAAESPAADAPWTLPDYFSFTQLAAYESCPLQYKFAHVLRIPVFGKPSLSFGKTVHATLERFMRTVAERGASTQTNLFDGERTEKSGLPVTKEELMAMYRDCWVDDWYDSKARKEEYRQKGERMLSEFYDDAAESPPRPLFLEKDFKLKIGDRWIRGKIDRIDAIDDGRAEIVDYKTGQAKDKLRPEDKRQLMLYQLAAERLMGLKVERLTYLYLEGGERRSFVGSDDDLAKFERDTAEKIERIRSGDFTPAPGPQCAFCDFKGICEDSSA